jgi:hypothetical protein
LVSAIALLHFVNYSLAVYDELVGIHLLFHPVAGFATWHTITTNATDCILESVYSVVTVHSFTVQAGLTNNRKMSKPRTGFQKAQSRLACQVGVWLAHT